MQRSFFGLCMTWTLLCQQGVLCSTLYQWIVDSQTRFNYDPDPGNMLGVYNWPRTYNSDCGGLHQSPIDIQLNQVRYGVTCRCPRLIYSSNYLSGTFKNNGHSAEFEPEDEMMLQLRNVPYRDGTYKLHDFHLHYGGVAGRNFELQGRRFRGSGIMSAGSEHTIDGLRFEGELHFVFSNNKYRDLEEADNMTDGIVVIVMLIQKLPMSMTGTMETSRFSEFLETNIPQIFPYQSNFTTEVDLTVFFNRSCEFYTYAGSTTTPTCHESVRWIILKDPLTVTERAWFQLTGLQSRGDFNSRYGNYRTTQPLNDRVVEANFDRPSESVLPSPTGESAIMMMMMSVLMNMMNVTSQDMIDLMGANRIDVSMFPNLAENIRNMPMRGMDRNALVPGRDFNAQTMSTLMNELQTPADNMRNMPQMEMNRNTLVPNLDGNTRNVPIRPMPTNGIVPDLDGNIRNMPMRPTSRNGIVPNLDGNTRNMPMRMMNGDGIVPNLNENTRNMPIMLTNMESLVPNIGENIRNMPMRQMTMNGLVPNLNGNLINANRMTPGQNVAGNIQTMPISRGINLPMANNAGNIRQLPMSTSMRNRGNVPNQVHSVIMRQNMPDTTRFFANQPNNVGNANTQSINMPNGNRETPMGSSPTKEFISSMTPWVWR